MSNKSDQFLNKALHKYTSKRIDQVTKKIKNDHDKIPEIGMTLPVWNTSAALAEAESILAMFNYYFEDLPSNITKSQLLLRIMKIQPHIKDYFDQSMNNGRQGKGNGNLPYSRFLIKMAEFNHRNK